MRKKLSEDYNLTICFPEIAKEWHPTKNGDLKPNLVFPKSGKKVWWICHENHHWEATIDKRSNGRGCPICAKKGPQYSKYLKSLS